MHSPSGIVFHKELLESGKWEQMSALAQMGNIGSEVGRALQAKSQGNAERLE